MKDRYQPHLKMLSKQCEMAARSMRGDAWVAFRLLSTVLSYASEILNDLKPGQSYGTGTREASAVLYLAAAQTAASNIGEPGSPRRAEGMRVSSGIEFFLGSLKHNPKWKTRPRNETLARLAGDATELAVQHRQQHDIWAAAMLLQVLLLMISEDLSRIPGSGETDSPLTDVEKDAMMRILSAKHEAAALGTAGTGASGHSNVIAFELSDFELTLERSALAASRRAYPERYQNPRMKTASGRRSSGTRLRRTSGG